MQRSCFRARNLGEFVRFSTLLGRVWHSLVKRLRILEGRD